MKRLFPTLLQELDSGHSAVLCGIVASRGSTPRGAGAKMLVLDDGDTIGTIGGGAAEERAARVAGGVLGKKEFRIASARLASGDAGNVGVS